MENAKQNAEQQSPVVLSVAELAAAIRRTLEGQYAEVRVRGELTRIFTAQSGHLYGSLRDLSSSAAIDLVLWKAQARRFASLLSEGAQVEITGRVSAYAPQSRYQLVATHVALVGVGALLAELERLKSALAKEGLFDRKRSLPTFPRTVGIITSPDGAVIEDMLHRLAERFPVRVLLWPVLVQGAGAAEQIAQAVRGFSALKETAPKDTLSVPVPDLVVVARGGGSLEDLWAFNEESVVRAIAASAIPVVSAVGHETDTTLADYAADLRAPTPTAAAELLTPERAVLLASLDERQASLRRAWRRRWQTAQEDLRLGATRLASREQILESPRLALDERSGGLAREATRACKDAALRLDSVGRRLAVLAPARRLDGWREQLEVRRVRLPQAMAKILTRQRDQLRTSLRLLESLDYHHILARGFALAQDDSGRVLRVAEDFSVGGEFRLTVSDSAEVRAETRGIEPRATEPQAKERKRQKR